MEAPRGTPRTADTMSMPSDKAEVVVVMPVFPRLPTIRPSLASLRDQTRPPDRVLLLDNGKNPDAELLQSEIQGPACEILKTEEATLAAALNHAVKHLENAGFIAVLQAGDFYQPSRIEKCLAAMNPPEAPRPPAIVVTGIEVVGSRGTPLPSEDARVRHFKRLWDPGRHGAPLSDWLGAGNFAGPISNIFTRREHLAANPLPEKSHPLAYSVVILAGLQGLLSVIDEPLLRHYPALPEREPSAKTVTDMLHVQLGVLLQLKSKLSVSPETRRHFATFNRVAWNNLSGLREDLFEQLLLRLASTMPPEDALAAAGEIMRSRDAAKPPAHWQALFAGEDPLDKLSYAAALRQTREELRIANAENLRLGAIAQAAQSSGWVRFGAWLGERSARRMMEMEEAPSDLQPPDGKGQHGGEADPQNMGHQEPSGGTTDAGKRADGQQENKPKNCDLRVGETGIAPAEEVRRP